MKPLFPIGQLVYLKVPNAEMNGMVTGHVLRPHGTCTYLVRWNDGSEDEHWDIELSTEREWGAAEGGAESPQR